MKGGIRMIKKPWAIVNVKTGTRLKVCFITKRNAKKHLKYIKNLNDKYKYDYKVKKRLTHN